MANKQHVRKRDTDGEEENQIGQLESSRDPLLNALRKYFHEHVSIPVVEQKRAKTVVEKIKLILEDNFKTSNFVFGTIYHQGSSYEGLKVIREDEFDLLVPIKMGTDLWKAEENAEGCNTHSSGYYFIKKVRNGATHLNDCVVNGYINPISTFRQMQSLVQGVVNQINQELFGITARQSVNGPALTINVTYDSRKQLSIDIVPCIELDGTRYVAKRHPKAESPNSRQAPGQNIYDQLWRRSYTQKEQIIISDMDWQNECRRACLKILKTIRVKRGASQLGMLSSYHLKTCMLYLNDDTSVTQWHQDYLHDRFKDLLRTLIKYMEKYDLPNFHNPSENLFEQFTQESLRNVLRWLREIVQSDQKIIEILLQGRDCQDITIDNFQVFVKTTNGNTLTFSGMKRSTLVRELKKKIEIKTGISPSQQLLVFGGKNLEDQRNLQSYGIANESTIQMTGRLRGG
ncbi:cyclic GMP-AMP synthase-like receptor 3 [Antedon mediterranea]|uniref:cyclic GMP-AMP synthase-like receptor 3 n=1 Tax=Antedon mediterranea TaxID=105859 RepID=UPI003AF5F838